MNNSFAETLKSLRSKQNLSQQQLANKLFVDRSSIANWENGRRLPDAIIISRLAKCLGVDVSILLDATSAETTPPNVILVDDEDILLRGAMRILSNVIPNAAITGFTKVSEALAFAQNNPVSIAFLDIEIGMNSGMDLCRELLNIYPLTNVIFLTAYPDYALNAWETAASGFLVKPLQEADVRKQLSKLRNPVRFSSGSRTDE